MRNDITPTFHLGGLLYGGQALMMVYFGTEPVSTMEMLTSIAGAMVVISFFRWWWDNGLRKWLWD